VTGRDKPARSFYDLFSLQNVTLNVVPPFFNEETGKVDFNACSDCHSWETADEGRLRKLNEDGSTSEANLTSIQRGLRWREF
jgi:hypothetical protein